MPLAFKDKPLTKQSFKLSPFVSKILIKNVMPGSKTYASKALSDKKRKPKFHEENVHISTKKMFL